MCTRQIKEEDVGGTCGIHFRETFMKGFGGNEKKSSGVLGLGVSIILKCYFVKILTVFIWLGR
jgi:hypothetical protein